MRKTAILFVALLSPAALAPDAVAGTITGTVVTPRVQKHRSPPRYYTGPYRGGRGREIFEKSGPTDVVVRLEGVKATVRPPAQPPRMAQKDETFVPHVLAVVADTTVEFPNEDDFYHNVFSVVSGDRFDLGRYPKGKSARQTFDKPGVVIVRCEIHPGMKAFILVTENSFFAVPDAEGRFEIKDVPAGSYTIKAWHPVLGEQSRPLVVPVADTVTIAFTF